MRHFKLIFIPMLLLFAAMASHTATAQTVVRQLQFGKQVIEVGADETVTFYDPKGFEGISSSSSNNAQSLTVFKPAEGMAIQITFERLDIRNDGNYYPAYVNVYAGDPDADNTFTYATTTSGVTTSSTLPSGTVLEKLDGTYTNLTYTGTDGSGIISVGYLYKYAEACEGWKGTVKCVTLENMTVDGASSNYDNVVANPDATANVNFATAAVTASGIMNADNVTGITFRVTGDEGVVNPLELRLYKGSKANFKGDNSIHSGVMADGDNYTFALNEALSEGENLFSIAGDFLGSAAVGSKAQVEITKVITAGQPDGVTPFTAGTPVQVAKPAIVLIGSTPQTITVGDIPYLFYDDGGKDANVTQGFEGQITFIPATEGQSIKVDFSKLDLFNTSTIEGYNDVFKFYNGREVNEANLITTLLDEAEIVKSTAADGSMTVYFKSTAGYPKSGWEATVSQFLPGDMTLEAVVAEADSETSKTVSAGDTNARMLVVDVQTDNTSNPLSLTALYLNTYDTKNIVAARAYYLGKKNTFATTNLFGEVAVTANNFSISGNQELIEGHNFFAVVLDIANTANTSDVVDISLATATVGDATVPPTSALLAERAVYNLCRATQGSHSHDIYGPWTFTNTEGYSGSGKYETENTDYIVTFTPKVENSVCEIDFSAFDVYYASSSYGTKAVFEIYSGTTVDASNILWQLQDAADANVGPGRKIRSTAADGSMTIRFNPKTTSSYNAGTGWTATVTPFVNHDMTIKNIVVTQTSSSEVGVGTADAALIDFQVETEGTLSLKTVTGVNLNLKDSQDNLSKVSIYYNNVNDRESAVLFGSVENPASSDVTVTGERALADGMNYFWMTADVKADAAADAVIDAALVSLTDANNVTDAVANGDPEGSRTVKYIYVIQSGSQEVTVIEPLLFYDDGGKDANITKGFKGTVIFVPGRENCAVEIVKSNQFSIGSGKMMIYSGREINDDKKLGNVTGYTTTNGPADLVSKAEDGCITVNFEANTTATTLAGWEIEIRLHEKTPFMVDDVEVVNTTDEVLRGTYANTMQQLKVVVSGDKDPINIGSVTFTADGTASVSDIAAAKVYCTGHNSMFSADNLLGTATVSAGDNTVTFDEPLSITENGDYYLWLTYDLADDATVGNTVAANVTAVGDIAVAATAAARNIKAGLKGNYIIGASSNATFANFAEATAALAGGVEGDVTFQVEDGTYAENVWFGSVPGAGEMAHITFTSLSGDRDKVVVTGSGSTENMPGSSSYKKGMVFVENTPYVTFEKMTFQPTAQSTYNYAVQIYDRSHHFTLRDCHVKADPVTSGYGGINLVQASPVNEEGRNNDYATFENNLLDGGYMGLNVGGTSYVALSREKGLVVRGNTINEAGSKGIYVNPEDDAVIDNNTIYQSKVQKTGYWGIDAMRVRGATVISNNKVTSETSYYSGGINLRDNCYGTEASPIRVYNNVVSVTNGPSTSSTGIQLEPTDKYIDVVNNTVRMGGSGGYAFYTSNSSSGDYTGINLQNNLFQNLTSSPMLFVGDRWFSNATFNNNAFYATSGNIKADTDIDAFNALDNVDATIAEQAVFVGETNLHLMEAGNLNVATPLAWLTVDADGVARDSEHPTLGAYEFAEVVDTKPEMAEGYPQVKDVTDCSATVVSKWNVDGKLYSKIEKYEAPEPGGARRVMEVSADDLLATTPVNVMADTEAETAFSDLEPSTQYVAYMMMVNDLDTQSDVVVTQPFTTERHITELAATVSQPVTIDAGENATLTVTPTGGDEPYTFEWRDQMNNVVGNEATLSVNPEYTYGYRVKVTSADGQEVNLKSAVIVRGDAVEATFEDNYLADESYFNGDNDDDTWYSGSYAFSVGNAVWPGSTVSFWYNYALSNQTSDVYSNLDDQYHSVMGGAREGSNFVIAYPQGGEVSVTHDAAGDVISGFYITNTAYAYYYLVNDNGNVSHAMRQGDWFKVTATDVDNSSNSVDFYLSDFRSENEADHYNIGQWEWFDLTPLGNVKGVTFTLSGSDTGQWGLNTPAYFAMDNFGGQPEMTEVTKVIKARDGEKIYLTDMFEYLRAAATVSYTLDGTLESDDMDIALDTENNRLVVNAKQDHCENTIVVAMTQKGHTQRVKLTIKVDNVTAINEVEAQSDVTGVTYVNPAGQVATTPWQGVNIVVTRHADGSVTTTKVVK